MMKKEKVFWGLIFIAMAVLIVLSQLGYLVNVSIFSIVLTVLFGAILLNSLKDINWFGIFFSLAIIGMIYAKPLGITALTPWPLLLVALLLTIGCSLIFTSRKVHKHVSHYDNSFSDIEESSDNDIVFETKFGSSAKYINSEDFRKAYVACSFGGIKLYLDNAQINDQATIDFDVNFGGVELYVPKTYKVINNVSCSIGAVDEKNYPSISGTKKLYLTGKVSFAGITITYI